jgi:hypothetical protein
MINGISEKVEREGIYKQYFDKFGEEPITYGLYWNDLESFEKLLSEATKTGVKYEEEEPGEGVVY